MSGNTEAGAVPIRRRPIPDQLDHFAELLAPLLARDGVDRETLLAVGATIVNLGGIAAQLRKSAPSGPLHPNDAAVAEMRAWIPEGTPDHALIELEAHTLRGVLAVLDGWRRNAFAVAAQRDTAERELAELRAQAREEWGEKYTGGGYLTRPDFAWMDERWPVEQWAWDHTRHGGVVGKRTIIVVEDWQKIRAKDLPKERPEASDD